MPIHLSGIPMICMTTLLSFIWEVSILSKNFSGNIILFSKVQPVPQYRLKILFIV